MIEVGSKCPLCGKRPKISAIRFPSGNITLPCSCIIDQNSIAVIETWEYAVIFFQKINAVPIKVRESHKNYIGDILQLKKEDAIMQVTYKGFTGELKKLERIDCVFVCVDGMTKPSTLYVLEIYDPEKKATVHFGNVNLADVKFSGGEVSFNG